jgi:hypothetical protein
MRRLPVVLALILAVVLAVDATAVTRSEHHFKMSFAKKAPGVPTAVSFGTDRFAYTAPPLGQAADRVATTVFVMHPGTRTDTRAVPNCTLATLEGNPDGCPAGSKVGTGTATAITGLSGLDPVSFEVTVYAARNGLLAHLSGLTIQNIELAMKGNRITANVPRICSPGGSLEDGCSNGDTVLKTLSVKLNARKRGTRALVRTPRRCPASGVWTNKAIYTFVNGDTETQTAATKCRK